jgi:hypothetical protein
MGTVYRETGPEITFHKSPVTDAGVAELQKALPNVQIFR